MTRSLQILALAALATLAAAPRLAAQQDDPGPPEAELRALREPVTLFHRNGQQFRGDVSGSDETTIQLRAIQGAGEILMTFPKEEIRDIHFPGDRMLLRGQTLFHEGKEAAALPYLEPVFIQRRPLFDMLEPEERLPFSFLPEAALAAGEPAKAVALVQELAPFYEDEETLDRLADTELVAYYQLGLTEEAEKRALAWVGEADRFSESALGFFIAGSIALEREEAEEALWLALEPIVFSGQLPVAYLDHCYSLAIVATHVLDNDEHREALLEEMRERGLEWRSLRAFATVAGDIDDLAIDLGDGPRPPYEAVSTEEELLLDQDQSVSAGSEPIDPAGLLNL